METVKIWVTGRVQGVGFRATVHRHAQAYGIKGYVSNLEDGRVEILAQGKIEMIHQFIENIKKRPGLGYIQSIETKPVSLTQSHESFEIH